MVGAGVGGVVVPLSGPRCVAWWVRRGRQGSERRVSCAVVGREANGAEVVVADVCTNKDAQCGHEKKPGKTEKKQKK